MQRRRGREPGGGVGLIPTPRRGVLVWDPHPEKTFQNPKYSLLMTNPLAKPLIHVLPLVSYTLSVCVRRGVGVGLAFLSECCLCLFQFAFLPISPDTFHSLKARGRGHLDTGPARGGRQAGAHVRQHPSQGPVEGRPLLSTAKTTSLI